MWVADPHVIQRRKEEPRDSLAGQELKPGTGDWLEEDWTGLDLREGIMEGNPEWQASRQSPDDQPARERKGPGLKKGACTGLSGPGGMLERHQHPKRGPRCRLTATGGQRFLPRATVCPKGLRPSPLRSPSLSDRAPQTTAWQKKKLLSLIQN